ncbi:MAG: hypothetical protein FWG85_05385 [Bacteroidetes bacterium]|nr:hypothetical protein [Bacteroidota bacterium]
MKNKLIMKMKNNFKGFIVVFVISATLFLCNYIESEASPVMYGKPQYIKGNYEVLNYFLDSLGISLPKNFPLELREYVSEGVFNLNSVEKRMFKEELREVLQNIPDKENKELFFVVFCEYMRNLWFYKDISFSYEYKVIEWSREQGLTNGRRYRNNCSFLIDFVYRNIYNEFWKEINKDIEENNSENDTFKPE